MEILNTSQYNQAISKYKLFSSVAGVGSIITTKMGFYILISDINKWDFIRKSQSLLDEIRQEEASDSKCYEKAKQRLARRGLNFINDKRFVEFLKEEKELPKLICLVGIPSISLNELFNYPNWKNHPIRKLLGEDTKAEDYMIKGTHFPKWFIGAKGELKPYNEWKRIWLEKEKKLFTFTPPRDANSPIKDIDGNVKKIKVKNENEGDSEYPLYNLLNQNNLILICPNGHLSDIPWSKYLKWKSGNPGQNDSGENLFDIEDCCTRPDLKWTESKTKSEGYGSIYIECLHCGCGSGNEGQSKINLEGINNLKPHCTGQKPWEMALEQDGSSIIPYEICSNDEDGRSKRVQMQVTLVTSNNVYFASGFSSLFIPLHLAENKSKELLEANERCHEKFMKYLKAKPGITKEEFWDFLNMDDFIIENGLQLEDKESFIRELKNEFLRLERSPDNVDRHEQYRWQEYRCFAQNKEISTKGLNFVDVELDEMLERYFIKIQQIEELNVNQVQLDFTRVEPKERIRIGNEIEESTIGKNIFSIDKNELLVLPANESFGEGIFFKFNDEIINDWLEQNHTVLNERFKNFLGEINLDRQGALIKQRIKNNGVKHFLIHTFGHILMRELEFSCGYPTASLKERLYISERMSGILIYTAEGAEGSMGGLVWQAQTKKIKDLIFGGLERAVKCSSDPLCWESDGQGIFDLNLAACFSCGLVSETACEEMNLGLDRRVLIDEDFGFFKNLIY